MKRLLLFTIIFFIITQLQAQGWGQTQKLVPDDREVGQQFGSTVDIDGNYAVVGVFANGGSEEAYVFENDGSGNWIQIQKLVSPDFNPFDQFGSAVAISGDYIFVGAWGEDTDSQSLNFLQAAGAVYIFKKQASGNFDFEQKIVASDREALNAFGYGIALNGDYAIVSPVRHDFDVQPGTNFLDDAGAAYIFERDGTGTWNEVQKIVASDRGVQDYFGQFALAVSGNYIAVGSYGEDEDDNGESTIPSAGSAYIFERDGNGTWNEVQKIVASDRSQGVFFGWSIGIYGDNLVVGSNQDNEFRGAAYIFERNINGNWNETQKLTASNALAGDRFGQDVDIEGNQIIVGAHYGAASPVADGAAYIFENQSSTWLETAFIYDIYTEVHEFFGWSVAISGGYAFVGAYEDDEDANEENDLTGAGAAFIFDVNEPNTLNVVENNFGLEFKAYPNPVKGLLNLDLGNYKDDVFIGVYNYLGQKIISKKYTNTNKIKLPLNVSKGLYLVEVVFDDKSKSVLKIMKY